MWSAGTRRVYTEFDRWMPLVVRRELVGTDHRPVVAHAENRGLPVPIDLFLKRFQLSDHFEVLGAAGGALHANQPGEVEQAHLGAEERDRQGVRQQIFVLPTSHAPPQQVVRTCTPLEREVQAGAKPRGGP